MSALLKYCTSCGVGHELTYFNKDRTCSDGLYPQCKDCSRANCRKIYVKYNEKHVALKRRWKAANRERVSEIGRAYRESDPQRHRAYTAAYRRQMALATPPWACRETEQFIREMCPEGFHVDHIYPLRGKNSCGLNVYWNLQYLPPDIHFKKGTKLPSTTVAGGYYL